jgi:hypothetical protein
MISEDVEKKRRTWSKNLDKRCEEGEMQTSKEFATRYYVRGLRD